MEDPKAIVMDYAAALEGKKLERVAKLLHPEFEFRAPGLTQTRSEFLAALAPLVTIVVRKDIKKVLRDGAHVALFYDLVTDTAAGSVPSAEWHFVENGLIRTLHLVFARTPAWVEAVAESRRRYACTGAGQ